jgi:FtsH-binding integral membrane protein
VQVYSIITLQLVLTTVVAAIVVANASVQHFLLQNVGVQIALMLVSMLALIPLYIWRNSHPHNLVLLGVWTCLFSGGWYCQHQVNKAVGLPNPRNTMIFFCLLLLQSQWAWRAASSSQSSFSRRGRMLHARQPRSQSDACRM